MTAIVFFSHVNHKLDTRKIAGCDISLKIYFPFLEDTKNLFSVAKYIHL